MDRVQRYECWPENPAKGVDGKMFPDRAGKWVPFADAERVLKALEELLKSFPAPDVLDALESDSGPGYRKYRTEVFTDGRIKELRAEVEKWKP